MYYVSIDYSITSPAICVYNSKNELSFLNCSFYFLTDKKKFLKNSSKNIFAALHTDYKNSQERFDVISNWAINCVNEFKPSVVFLEGYSFASKGLVFNIAENTGLLKHKLYKQNYEIKLIEPKTMKKFITGKGNADKILLNDFFISSENIDVKNMLGQSKNIWTPSSDIIDSYFLMKTGLKKN